MLVIPLASHVWHTSHRYAVATWTEFNHTQAAAVAEKREGGWGDLDSKKQKQKNKNKPKLQIYKKSNARDQKYCLFSR